MSALDLPTLALDRLPDTIGANEPVTWTAEYAWAKKAAEEYRALRHLIRDMEQVFINDGWTPEQIKSALRRVRYMP